MKMVIDLNKKNVCYMPVNILTKINGSIYVYIENYKKGDTFYSALKITRLIDLRTFGISISMHI